MKTLVTLLLLAATSAHAQNAGGKGYDSVHQAEYDRAIDIQRMAAEIRVLTYKDGRQKSFLQTAVARWVPRAARNATFYTRRGTLAVRELNRGGALQAEAWTFDYGTPDSFGRESCGPNGERVGAWSPGTSQGRICLDPDVLASDFYAENMLRNGVSLRDRLLSAAVHEIAHNLGLQHGYMMDELTYLVEHTGTLGWKDIGLTGERYDYVTPSQYTVDLTISPEVDLDVSSDSEACLKAVDVNGTRIGRGRKASLPLDVNWDITTEGWSTRGSPFLQPVRLDVTLVWDKSVTPAHEGGCFVNIALRDAEGNGVGGFLGIVSVVDGSSVLWMINLTQ